MTANQEDMIRERAYQIWEREGRPQGRDLEHWLIAEAELRGAPERKAAKATRKAVPRKAKAEPQSSQQEARPRRKRASLTASPAA